MSEAEYAALAGQARQARRRTSLPVPAFVRVGGLCSATTRRLDGADRPPCRRRARLARSAARPRRSLRPRPLRDDHVAHRLQRTATTVAHRSADEAVRSAVPHARVQSREHDLRRLPHHADRPLSRLRRGRLRLGTAGGRHAWVGPGRGARLYKPLGQARSSSRPMRAPASARSTSSTDDAVVARYGQTLVAGRRQPRLQPWPPERPANRRVHRRSSMPT